MTMSIVIANNEPEGSSRGVEISAWESGKNRLVETLKPGAASTVTLSQGSTIVMKEVDVSFLLADGAAAPAAGKPATSEEVNALAASAAKDKAEAEVVQANEVAAVSPAPAEGLTTDKISEASAAIDTAGVPEGAVPIPNVPDGSAPAAVEVQPSPVSEPSVADASSKVE